MLDKQSRFRQNGVSEGRQNDLRPKRMICYANMLYPQYEAKFEKTISPDTWEYLQKQAKELLVRDNELTNGNVLAHWKEIAGGKVPFGYMVEKP